MSALLRSLVLAQASAAVQPAPVAQAAPFGAQWTAIIGTWSGEGQGQSGVSGGESSFAFELAGHVIVRRSYADYPAAEGRPAVHHEDLLVIYPEGGATGARAAYFDNEGHVIEYAASWSSDGETLTLWSDARQGAPRFRLTYHLLPPERMSVAFDIAPPGTEAFAPYVGGVLHRVPGR